MSKLSKKIERLHEKARKKMKADGTRRGPSKKKALEEANKTVDF